MEKKKGFGEKLEAFFAGKGFYIVLILCVAVIGVSAWSMLADRGTVEEPGNNIVDAAVQNTPATRAPVTASPPPADAIIPEAPEIDEVGGPTETENDAAVWAPQEPADTAPTAFLWPVEGAVEVPYAVTSLIYNRTMADWRTHDGVDIQAELGTHVMAAASGTVENMYYDDMYGMTVIISHGGGLKSVYSNLAETPTVGQGDSVVGGEVIGAVGATALCETGEVYHLHFAMTKDGVSVDPTEYLPLR
jgi:murein DD-endopeptidase MepM/ murein hydrolase activator NlpD